MNILLGKFNNNNDFNLDTIINCYQDYFIFEVKNNETFLYLDTKVLKRYLKEGIDIKYRKYIFSFLKNSNEINSSEINNSEINSNSYKLLNTTEKIIINKNNIHDKLNINIENIDIENLELIINLSNKIIKNKNKFILFDKNIIKLDKNFYANINLSRFFYLKKDKIYNYNGIILNYHDENKNKLLSLLSIIYLNKNNFCLENEKTKDKLQFNTKCVLIISETNEIDNWIKIIKEYSNNSIFNIINSKKDIQKILNKDILKLNFLIINSRFINHNYFKNYFYKYYNDKNKELNVNILNSLYDNLYNKNINNQLLNNLYLFNWKCIIFDNIENIKKMDKNNYIHYLSSTIKYYLVNNNLDNTIINYVIKNSISSHVNNVDSINNIDNLDNINNIDTIDNIDYFYYFLKKELVISNNKNLKLNCNFIKLSLSDNENKIYKIFFENNLDIQKISLFLTNPEKYNFNLKSLNEIYEINKCYYTSLICNEYKKINNIKNFFKNKKEDININTYINEYFSTNLFFKETEKDIDLLIKNINNNINLYNLKILYFKNIVNEFKSNDYYCSICLDTIDKINFSIINCSHYFCKDCIRKYINEKENCLECPNCRECFSINDIYIPLLNNSENDIIKGTKINKIKEIVNNIDNKKIIIITQFNDNIKIKDLLDIKENINYYHLFHINNFIKEKNRNMFCKEKNKSVLFCNYDDILKYYFNNLNTIIFIDYPQTDINNNIFLKIKNNYMEKYICDDNIIFNFIYIDNTFEKDIIDIYIK